MDLIQEEQLAAQIVAVMNAHFTRPSPDQKRRLLYLAVQQVAAEELCSSMDMPEDVNHAA